MQRLVDTLIELLQNCADHDKKRFGVFIELQQDIDEILDLSENNERRLQNRRKRAGVFLMRAVGDHFQRVGHFRRCVQLGTHVVPELLDERLLDVLDNECVQRDVATWFYVDFFFNFGNERALDFKLN